MEYHSLAQSLHHQRVFVDHHALELPRRVDEKIERWPHIVEAGEVLEPLEERPVSFGDDDEVEIAPLVALATSDRSEHDDLDRGLNVRRHTTLELVEICENRADP